jgi:hypothetical protein
LLVPYWQAGQFFTGPDAGIQKWLAQTDEKVLHVFRRIVESSENGGWARYFETAYLMCYPLVPIGLAALYLGHHRAAADFYWIVVVLASDTRSRFCSGHAAQVNSEQAAESSRCQ